MLRIRTWRTIDRVTAPDGRTATLVSRTWRAAVRTGPGGLAWSYRLPTSVELASPDGAVVQTRVVDHVLVLRAAAVLLVLAARLIRRRDR